MSAISRSHFADDAKPTLADMIERIQADATVPPRRRAELASALRTMARAIGQPPEEIRSHPAYLRDHLKHFAPAMLGISASRWANVLSLTRAALEHAGTGSQARRCRVPFAPAWTRVMALIPEKHAAISLSRLARFCSTHGIDPAQMDDAVFVDFLRHLEEDTLTKLPRKVHRRAAVVWNRMVIENGSWPQHRVTLPNYSRVYALPLSTFPESFQAELTSYLARLVEEDPFPEDGFRQLRPATIRTYRLQLCVFASALVHQGRAPESLRSLDDLLDLETIKLGLRFFLARAPGGSKKQAHGIGAMLFSMARRLQVPAERCQAIRVLMKKIEQRQAGMTDKNRERLRQFDDPKKLNALLCLPEQLVADAEAIAKPGVAEALQVQAAVGLRILRTLAIRRQNLHALEVQRHFPRNRGNRVWLRIPGPEVKNGRMLEAELPTEVVRLMDLYLSKYRPLLLSQPSAYLFPGVADRPKSRERLAYQMVSCLRERCGLIMNLHLFRHLNSKLYLDRYPGAYGVVMALNGHTSEATTRRFYCGMETASAARRFDEHILERRAELTEAATISKSRRSLPQREPAR